MKLKWNWGTGILTANIVFVVFMLGMVYLCTRQHFDLVTADYYEQELKYQQVIDGMNNENRLGKKTIVSMDDENVTVTLPVDKIDDEGKVVFYKPDNARYDFAVALNGKTEIVVPVSKFNTGIYTVKATWQFEGKPYHNEQTIYMP